MPTLLERPETKTTQRVMQPPRPVRSFRWLRWAGWLLAVVAVAVVAGVVINANLDDGVVATQPTTIETPTNNVVFTPAAPAPDLGAPLGFGTEATVTPLSGTRLVEHAPGFIQAPDTAFMEEATTTPGLTGIGYSSIAARRAETARLNGMAGLYGMAPELPSLDGHPDMNLPSPIAL